MFLSTQNGVFSLKCLYIISCSCSMASETTQLSEIMLSDENGGSINSNDLARTDNESNNDDFIVVHRKRNRDSHYDPYDVAINKFLERCGLQSNLLSLNNQVGRNVNQEIQHSLKPLVIISRGIPGCGKSYLSKRIETASISNNRPCYICSADKFFEQSGQYVFDASRLGEAHRFCRNAFQAALCVQNAVIIIDNTNTTQWEYQAYFQEAINSGAAVHIVEISLPINKPTRNGGKGKTKGNPLPPKTLRVLQACASRNTHSVPLDAIEKMFRRWEDDERAVLIPVGGM